MNTSGDAAESIVRMSLQGFEVAVKLTGSGAKNVAAIMVAMLKDQKQTKGKTRLTSMLKSGKELKVFTVKEEDLRKFTEEAKRYGVLFCALKGKGKSLDGMVDIMVRAEDASKINRIVDRFNLATVDTASIKSEIQKSKDSKDKGVVWCIWNLCKAQCPVCARIIKPSSHGQCSISKSAPESISIISLQLCTCINIHCQLIICILFLLLLIFRNKRHIPAGVFILYSSFKRALISRDSEIFQSRSSRQIKDY